MSINIILNTLIHILILVSLFSFLIIKMIIIPQFSYYQQLLLCYMINCKPDIMNIKVNKLNVSKYRKY